MEHLAIMRKSWGLTDKILAGEKTVESRWYKFKRDPWDKIRPGDVMYFKDSGEPVTIKARVTRVLQFENLTSTKTKKILEKYGEPDLGIGEMIPEIEKYISNKNYCVLIFFEDVKRIRPFNIDKTGFGTMSAWISIDDINKIKTDDQM
jgi:ASC-1-like (ASCH) protein